MKKLAALRAALLSWQLFRDNQLDTWATDIQLRLSGKVVGDGVLAAEMTYTTVVAIDRYSYQHNPVEQLIAELAMYLLQQDGSRKDLDNHEPQMDIVGLDDHTADIEITLPFREQIHLIESENGTIQAGGKRWALQQPTLLTAENLNGVTGNRG